MGMGTQPGVWSAGGPWIRRAVYARAPVQDSPPLLVRASTKRSSRTRPRTSPATSAWIRPGYAEAPVAEQVRHQEVGGDPQLRSLLLSVTGLLGGQYGPNAYNRVMRQLSRLWEKCVYAYLLCYGPEGWRDKGHCDESGRRQGGPRSRLGTIVSTVEDLWSLIYWYRVGRVQVPGYFDAIVRTEKDRLVFGLYVYEVLSGSPCNGPWKDAWLRAAGPNRPAITYRGGLTQWLDQVDTELDGYIRRCRPRKAGQPTISEDEARRLAWGAWAPD